MGHLAAFMASVALASQKAGRALQEFAKQSVATFKAAKEKLRRHRLFAKTREGRLKLLKEMVGLVETTQARLAVALAAGGQAKERLVRYGKVAQAKAARLHETMKRLLPQVRHWMRTGKVATGKIINVHIPELYSIVRGKVGKAVEFGLKWGFTRLRGGFILAKVSLDRGELTDTKFAVQAVEGCITLFDKAPRAYAYDRGGWSKENVARLKRLKVKQVGLAPPGAGAVAGQWEESRGVGQGASASRSEHRSGEERAVRVSPACGAFRADGVRLRPTGCARLQPEQVGPRAGEAKRRGPGRVKAEPRPIAELAVARQSERCERM